MDYIKYPPTIRVLISEIIRVTDDYFSRRISESDLRKIIIAWANGDKLFDGPNRFNPTIVQRIGKKRIKLIEKMLVGQQLTFC